MKKTFLTLPLSIYNLFKTHLRGGAGPPVLPPKRLRPFRECP